MSSLWKKQLNLIVPYFVRIHFENTGDDVEFPSDLKGEIQRFAARSVDNWYSKIIGPGIVIEDKVAKFTKQAPGWRAVYSTYTCDIENGECIEWALRLRCKVYRGFYISIMKDDKTLLDEKKSFRTWRGVDNNKYVYLASNGTSRLATNKSVSFPGEKFASKEDTLVIIVDKNKKVSIRINDKHYGSAPNFILKPQKYRLAVHFVGPTCEIEFC